jgi:hypothetical protein
MLGRQLVGLDARAQIQKKFIKFDTELPVGTLVALDPTTYNKGVVADNTSEYPAVGFVYQGSAESFGEQWVDEPDRGLTDGRGMNVYIEGQLVLETATFTDAEVASRIAIYEGVDGAWTKTIPTGVGTRVREIGFVYNKNTIWCDFSRDPRGITL